MPLVCLRGRVGTATAVAGTLWPRSVFRDFRRAYIWCGRLQLGVFKPTQGEPAAFYIRKVTLIFECLSCWF